MNAMNILRALAMPDPSPHRGGKHIYRMCDCCEDEWYDREQWVEATKQLLVNNLSTEGHPQVSVEYELFRKGNLKEIKKLVDTIHMRKPLIDKICWFTGFTKLHFSAAASCFTDKATKAKRCFEAAEILLQNGANADPLDKRGITPLGLVMYFNFSEMTRKMTELLLSAGADPSKMSNGDVSPMYSALGTEGFEPVVRLMMDYRTAIDRDEGLKGDQDRQENLVYSVWSQRLDLKQRERCRQCGKSVPSKTCSNCHLAAYCSTPCQTKDWNTHKPECKLVRNWLKKLQEEQYEKMLKDMSKQTEETRRRVAATKDKERIRKFNEMMRGLVPTSPEDAFRQTISQCGGMSVEDMMAKLKENEEMRKEKGPKDKKETTVVPDVEATKSLAEELVKKGKLKASGDFDETTKYNVELFISEDVSDEDEYGRLLDSSGDLMERWITAKSGDEMTMRTTREGFVEDYTEITMPDDCKGPNFAECKVTEELVFKEEKVKAVMEIGIIKPGLMTFRAQSRPIRRVDELQGPERVKKVRLGSEDHPLVKHIHKTASSVMTTFEGVLEENFRVREKLRECVGENERKEKELAGMEAEEKEVKEEIKAKEKEAEAAIEEFKEYKKEFEGCEKELLKGLAGDSVEELNGRRRKVGKKKRGASDDMGIVLEMLLKMDPDLHQLIEWNLLEPDFDPKSFLEYLADKKSSRKRKPNLDM